VIRNHAFGRALSLQQGCGYLLESVISTSTGTYLHISMVNTSVRISLHSIAQLPAVRAATWHTAAKTAT